MFCDFQTAVSEGMVVLDAVLLIQAEQANDLAVRWNCRAGVCGSCSAEINGHPKLMCMTRLKDLTPQQPITIEPMHTFPVIKDLVTDVSWNYRVKKGITPFQSAKPETPGGWRIMQDDIARLPEFRRCIECWLCQDVCHVLREHQLYDQYIGPRFFVETAYLEMHPLDTGNRLSSLRDNWGLGYCNITKCCTVVCPAEIKITDNAIIPLKERVVDEFYDPLVRLLRRIGRAIGLRKQA